MLLVGALLVAAAVGLFLVHPMVKGLHASLDRQGDELTETEARKRVALLALRDVEYDYMAGKLDEVDYRAMKGKLTAEALAALEADEAARDLPEEGATGSAEVEARIARMRAELRAHPAGAGAAPSGAATGTEGALECGRCRYANPAGSRFCAACGHRLVSQAAG